MKLTLILVWTFAFLEGLHNDQSLSFSLPRNSSTAPIHSYWHGTIPSTLLNVRLQLYLNKQEGLVFYAIDNLYKTLWMELDHGNIIIGHYNFGIENVKINSYNSKMLCNITLEIPTVLNLKFSFVKDDLHISCNRRKKTLYYSMNPTKVNNITLLRFLEDMKYPVPLFNSNNTKEENITFIWIGNTPATDTIGYRNQKLLPHKDNFQGCVYYFKEDVSAVNLTSSGHIYGNMIEPFCNHVCRPNTCYNKAQCVESWRGRYKCLCGLSKFTGKFCNKKYAVEFDGSMSVNYTKENTLDSLQIGFNPIKMFGGFQGSKIFSLELVLNQYLYAYIDSERFLQIRFTKKKKTIIDKSFQSRIQNNNTYILFFEVKFNNITFKLVNSDNKNSEQTSTSSNLANMIYTNILIGDTHGSSGKSMARFTGCISNLIIRSGEKRFIWNKIPNFDKLPQCSDKKRRAYRINETEMAFSVKVSASQGNPILDGAISNKIIIIIALVGLILIIITSIVMAYVYKLKTSKDRIKSSTKKKLILSNDNGNNFSTKNTTYIPHNPVPNSLYISYKPAYKARSISNSSCKGKSMISLPLSIQSTFVNEEEENV